MKAFSDRQQQYAHSQVEFYRKSSPDVISLALMASLARKIESELLRALRVNLAYRFPQNEKPNVETEFSLWFSTLVESRGTDSITLMPAVSHILRDQLKEDSELLTKTRQIILDCHKSIPPIIKWEEELVYYSLLSKDEDKYQELIYEAVLKAAKAVQNPERKGLVEWVSKMYLRMPQVLLNNDNFMTLLAVSQRQIITKRNLAQLKLKSFLNNDIVLRIKKTGKHVEIGKTLENADFQCSVPNIFPIILFINDHSEDNQREVISIPEGKTIRLELKSIIISFTIQTVDGRIYHVPLHKETKRESEQTFHSEKHSHLEKLNLSDCPVCSREILNSDVFLVSKLSKSTRRLIKANSPGVENLEAVCGRCVRLFEKNEKSINENAAVLKDGSHVLSMPLRLDADDRFTGKGVTIAFLDSGFYPHVDLTTPQNRIIAYRDLNLEEGDLSTLFQSDVTSWHGMVSSVVTAGNGSLSNGFYRGLAPEANVVLVKLARTGRISEKEIQDGLEWVLGNYSKYNIRIINMSVGSNVEDSYLYNSLAQAVEDCTSLGILVVCGTGNSGNLPDHLICSPANAPSCITVGGFDDNNSIDRKKRIMYRSSYGPTIDGFQKPEIIAPSMWVPMPILPDTPTAMQAEFLTKLDNAEDEDLHQIVRENPGIVAELDTAIDRPIHSIRQIITLKIKQENIITKHYKYLDGTGASTNIVSAVAAQMLEANPNLTPQQIKRIMIFSAERLPHYEVDRQGWGAINPRRAIDMALQTIT